MKDCDADKYTYGEVWQHVKAAVIVIISISFILLDIAGRYIVWRISIAATAIPVTDDTTTTAAAAAATTTTWHVVACNKKLLF